MSFIPQTVVGMYNAREQTMMNDWTKEMSEKQYEENMAFQREQYEYAKGLQAEQWNREDTALQRHVADARASGISPLAGMQGSSSSLGSASVGGVAGQAPALQAPSVNVGDPVGQLLQGISAIQDIRGKKISNDLSSESLDFQRSNNKFLLAQNLYKTISDSAILDNLLRDTDFKMFYGITDSMDKEQKLWQIIKREVFGKPASVDKNHRDTAVGNDMYSTFFDSPQFGKDQLSADDLKAGLNRLFGGSKKLFNLKDDNPLFNFLLSLVN